MSEDDNTVESVRDDLDNYGNHLVVYWLREDGDLFELGEIHAIANGPGGTTCVVIEIGPKAERGHEG